VRRSRLYYLRDRVGKAARIKPGPRSRFEALTAPGAVPEPEEDYIEEEAEFGEDGATPEAELAEESGGDDEGVQEEAGVEEVSAGAAAEAVAADAGEGEAEASPGEPELAEGPTKT